MNTLWKLQENINIAGQIFRNEPMAAHTTFHAGGAADFFIIPKNTDELCSLASQLKRENVSFFVLGSGSNLLAADGGIEGAVLSTENLNAIDFTVRKTADKTQIPSAIRVPEAEVRYIRADAGCSIKKLTAWCTDYSLSGFETFGGLPGTVGGALFMNARCYGHSFSDFAESVSFFNPQTDNIEEYIYKPSDWAYKKSPFQNTRHIILSAVLRTVSADGAVIGEKTAACIDDRTRKGHFRYPSAGSVFKNNHAFGKPSGQIIDEAGLRGYRIGNAQIAPWHGNFIINLGGAASSDIRRLIEYTIEAVKERTGFILEPEVLFIGRW